MNNELNSLKQLEDEKEKQLLELEEKLITLRRSIIRTIDTYNRKLNSKREELKDVNEQICSLVGHDFTVWEEHEDKYLDRSWYYERKCVNCGKKETVFNDPNEDISNDHTNKVYLHKKTINNG